MAKDLPMGRRIMDRAWMRDEQGIEHTGEALMLAMLLRVKKNKNRTAEQEQELEDIISKRKKRFAS